MSAPIALPNSAARRLFLQRHGLAEAPAGPAHGADQQPVAHRAAVDEEIFMLGIAPVQGRQASGSGQSRALACRIQGQRVGGEIAPHDPAEAGEARGAGWLADREDRGELSPAKLLKERGGTRRYPSREEGLPACSEPTAGPVG